MKFNPGQFVSVGFDMVLSVSLSAIWVDLGGGIGWMDG